MGNKKLTNLRIERVSCSRINNTTFNLFYHIWSILQDFKNGTVPAKELTETNDY